MTRDAVWQDTDERADAEAYIDRLRNLAEACRTERTAINERRARRKKKRPPINVADWTTENIRDAIERTRAIAEVGEPLEDYLLLLAADPDTIRPNRLYLTDRGLHYARTLWHRAQHAAGDCDLHELRGGDGPPPPVASPVTPDLERVRGSA